MNVLNVNMATLSTRISIASHCHGEFKAKSPLMKSSMSAKVVVLSAHKQANAAAAGMDFSFQVISAFNALTIA